MGNSIGPALDGNCTTVMKISGETLKLRTPVLARQDLVDYPGYALLESESVKQFGIRAKPLDIYQHLEPKKLYFLIELRKYLEEISRQKMAGSETTMNKTCAKDRLESLMLARRSISSDPSTPPHSSNTKGEDILEEAGDGCRKLKMQKKVMFLPVSDGRDQIVASS